MLNYAEAVKELQEKDMWAVDKLGLYFELTMVADLIGCSNEDFNEIVDYLHDIYFDNDETDFRYPGYATAAAMISDYNCSNILASIRENGEQFKKQILEKFKSLCE